jgi:hypothetical protein
MRQAPKDHPRDGRCGSTAEVFGATGRRLAPQPCLHGRDKSGMLTAQHRNPTPLLPRPDEPFELTEIQVSRRLGPRPKPQPTDAPQITDQTTVRPPSTELTAIACRLPTISPRGGRRARNHQVLALHEQPPSCPGRCLCSAHPGSGSTQRAGWSIPGVSSAAKTLDRKQENAHRTSGHVPRGTPMLPSSCDPRWSVGLTTKQPRSTRALTPGGCPLPERMGARLRSPPQAAMTRCSSGRPQRRRKRPSKLGIPPPRRAVPGSSTLARPLQLGAFGPSPARLCKRPTDRVRKRTLT